MTTAVIAAAAAALTLAATVLVARIRSVEQERRFEATLHELDQNLGAVSNTLERVVDRSADTRAGRVDDLDLTVDFEDLLHRLAAEAAARVGADAAAVHVRGPGGAQTTATFGAENRPELLQAPLGRGAGPFRAVTINWTFQPVYEQESDEFASALVVPIAEAGVETGTLAAYARAPGAFGADHVRSLEILAEEAVPAIQNARRFAEARRAMTDDLTGLPDRRGFEMELERAVTRAQYSGLPLSLLVLNSEEAEHAAPRPGDVATDRTLQQLATLLTQVTRTTDVVCRLGAGRFGVLLPETTADGARRLYTRLRDEASRVPFQPSRQLTFAAGVVEWRPNDTSDVLDARARAALGRSRVDPLELVPASPAREGPGTAAQETPAAADSAEATPRRHFHDRLAREVRSARRLGRPLTVAVLEVEGLPADRDGGRWADHLLANVEMRIRIGLPSRGVGMRIGDSAFGLILPGSTASAAEVAVAELQASVETRPAEDASWLAVSAGITELAPGDDAGGLLSRAEEALRRAKGAGRGTVVVATPGDQPEG